MTIRALVRAFLGSAPYDAIAVALVADYTHHLVRLEFDASVTWVGLQAEDARALAQMLVELAESVERGQGRRREDHHG